VEQDTPVCGIQKWVHCDKCKVWYHFVCVGVNIAIAQLDWIFALYKDPEGDEASTSGIQHQLEKDNPFDIQTNQANL